MAAFARFALFYAFAGVLIGLARVGANALLGRDLGQILGFPVLAGGLYYFFAYPPSSLRVYRRDHKDRFLDGMGFVSAALVPYLGSHSPAETASSGDRSFDWWVTAFLVLAMLTAALVRSMRAREALRQPS